MFRKHDVRRFGDTVCLAIFVAIFACSSGAIGYAETGFYELDNASIPVKNPSQAPMVALTRAGSRLVAAGLHGVIILSDDSGASWTQASVPVDVTLTDLYFTSDQDGWAAGHYGTVLHTTDGGRVWTKALDGTDVIKMLNAQAQAMAKNIEPAVDPAAASTPVAAATVSATAAATPGAASGSSSSAASMGMNTSISVATPVETLTLEHVASVYQKAGPSKPFLTIGKCGNGLLAVGQQDISVVTADDGKNWTEWTSAINDPGYQNFYGILNLGDSTFLIGEEGMVLKSGSGCTNFAPVTGPFTATLFGGVGLNPTSFVVYGLDGGLYKTADSGLTWKTFDMPADSVLDSGIVLPSGAVLIGSVNGRLYLSDTAVQNFHQIATTLPFDVADMAFAPNGDLIVAGNGGVLAVAPQLIR